MSAVVLDASVAVKWFLQPGGERLIEEAAAVAQRYQTGDLSVVVPDLFWAEVGNFFWKGVRQHRFSPDVAEDAIQVLKSKAFPTFPTLDLIGEALNIALGFQRSVYDSIYVALAMQLDTVLITADEKLVNAVGSRLPVKWLGAF